MTKEPADSVRKARRRRVPDFEDEPIQWHRNNTKHDRCPWCGLPNMCYLAKLHRSCDNCDIAVDVSGTWKSGKAWYEHKLGGGNTCYDENPGYRPLSTDGKETFDLLIAQRMSSDGIARLDLTRGYGSITIRWHKDGLVPERKDSQRMMSAGSLFWHWTMRQVLKKIWLPNSPLNEMEVLARAVSDDPIFAIMID